MKLTDAFCRKAKSDPVKTLKFFDGGGMGMFFQVSPSGRKSFRLKYRLYGQENSTLLGVYPICTLKEAREEAIEVRRLVAKGINPSQERARIKQERAESKRDTFKKVAEDWFDFKKLEWSEEQQKRVSCILRRLYPFIGEIPVQQLTQPKLLEPLYHTCEEGYYNLAKRAMQYANKIFLFAISEGRAQNNPVIGLADRLPSQPKTKHHAAIISPKKLGSLLLAIDAYQGGGKSVVRYALRLMPLVFVRTKELRFAEWVDIDWDESQYYIGREKMKMKEEHIVPLSRQALEILKEVRMYTGKGRYVFPGRDFSDKPMGRGALTTALRTISPKGEMSIHGFRATARTMLREQLKHPTDWIEMQLAHAVPEAHGRAYNRATNLEDRRMIMQDWADYLDKLKEEASARENTG